MLLNKTIKALQLSEIVEGKLYGEDVDLNGEYTFLNKASSGDIVIRHWINSKGIQIAKNNNVACVITQNPKDNAIEESIKLNLPLIVTDNIEYATAFSIKETVQKYASQAFKMAVTGTNGKSTTSHLLYSIFNDLGYNIYTNTDAESEGNTLIDPRVSTEIVDFYNNNKKIEAISLEVSEVQGWDDKIMKNHSYQMISALGADVSIITNASADHMNLVESFNDLLYEISGAARALLDGNKDKLLVLNYEDEKIRRMANIIENKSNISLMMFGYYHDDFLPDVYYKDNIGIYVENQLYIEYDKLPFTSKHFIQDIMAVICVCVYKQLNHDKVVESLNNYSPLSRRFIKLKDNPVIIDDFAHNPAGIKLTIENGSVLGNDVYIVNAIRGSRGDDINEEISQALVEALNNKNNYRLILTTSTDVVNHLNTVTDSELEIFTKVLDKNNISYELFDKLEESLIYTINNASDKDVILLLGAQGMDPASGLLEKNHII